MPKIASLGILRSGFHLRGPANAHPDGKQCVIQLGDVRDGTANFDRVIRMDVDRARPKDYLAPGDILLRSRGSSYGAALVASCPSATLAAAPLYVLRLEVSAALVDPEYLVWYINRPATQSRLGAYARGTHVPTVSLEAFGDLEVVLPAPAEQRRILGMERLFQEERDLNTQYLARRGQLVRIAQETILEEAIPVHANFPAGNQRRPLAGLRHVPGRH